MQKIYSQDGNIKYVDNTVTSANNGTSWTDIWQSFADGNDSDPSLDEEYKPDFENDLTLDADMDLSEFFDFDIDDISRPQSLAWDIGAYEYTTATNISNELTEGIQLHSIYPNPFKSNTSIAYSLLEDSEIEILLYDINGRRVKTVYSGSKNAGIHITELLCSDLSPGIYFIKLRNKNSIDVKKCLIVK